MTMQAAFQEGRALCPRPGFDINELKRRMQGATQALKHELGGLRTGRAAARCWSRCRSMPTARTCRSISSRPSACRSRAALGAGLGQVDGQGGGEGDRRFQSRPEPATEGQVLRLRIPELNEERRKELVKVAHKYAEAARVAVRHVRRDGLDVVKKLEKNHEISEDDQERLANEVQKATDGTISRSISCLRPRKRKSSPSDGALIA
jgi:ribosome recycling factor